MAGAREKRLGLIEIPWGNWLMSRVKYHREQAKVLTALAMFAENLNKAKMYNLAAIEHLERAEDLEQAELAAHDDPKTALAGQHGRSS